MKMKTLVFSISLLFISAFYVNAQTGAGLQFMNYKNGKTVFIKEGARLMIKKEGKKFKGNFKVISDQQILLNTDTLSSLQIQEIFTRTGSSQISGAGMLLPGAFMGAMGISGLITMLAEAGGYAIIGVVLLSPVIAAGILMSVKGAQLWHRGKRFGSYKWAYVLKN